MTKASAAYDTLAERFSRIGKLAGIQQLLFWDAQTAMPRSGAPNRGEQSALLSGLSFDIVADPATGDLLDEAEAARDVLAPSERADLREMRRYWLDKTIEPRTLVVRRSRAVQQAQQSWLSAKQANDFALFAADFEEMVACHREAAAIRSASLKVPPTVAMMQSYDPGLSAGIAEELFSTLSAELPGLLKAAAEVQARWPAPQPFSGDFSAARQQALCARLIAATGLEADAVCTGIAPHPFTMGSAPGDVRFANRYEVENFAGSVIACLHETGHALYELNLPRAWSYRRVGQARGASVHESQALILDRHVGRDAEFLTWLAPQLRAHFGGDADQWSPPRVVAHFHRLNRGSLRLKADEMSYLLHIVLRHRIESALISGDLSARELPTAWREIALDLFGAAPADDATGCLQDFHWSAGYMGYFASYAIGAALAAQFSEAAFAENSTLPAEIGRGELGGLHGWMRRKIHEMASLMTFDDLVVAVTGKSLSATALIAHLQARYVNYDLPTAPF